MLIEIKNRIWWICDCILELRLIPYQEWRFEEAMSDKNSKYFSKYLSLREPNLHKMKPIPICKFKND